MSFPVGARIRGIDAPLPPGESIRWEGRPAWRPLAWRAFFGRTVVVYFTLLAGWQLVNAAAGAKPWAVATGAVLGLALLAGLSLACSALLATLSARTTVYAITDRRVVLKVGIVIPSVVSIPFRLVETVAAKAYRAGDGDLAVRLVPGDRVAYSQLWPHVRPWHFTRPEPSLRALPDVREVGRILQQALADADEMGTFGSAPAGDTPVARPLQRTAPLGASASAVTAGMPT